MAQLSTPRILHEGIPMSFQQTAISSSYVFPASLSFGLWLTIQQQYVADNPGVWPFHCHIAWHVSGGLYANMMEGPDLIEELDIPQIMHQTCRDWAAYTNTTVIDQ
jgi:hypothetical protein